MARELAGCLNLRPHGAGGETEFFHFVRVRLADGFLRGFAVIDEGGVDVGGDHQQIAVELFGQQRRAQVLVDHRFHALQLAVGAVHRWDAATAGADHDAAFFQQPLDRADFEDAFRSRAGHHATELVAVRGNRPAFFSGEFFRFRLGVHRADGFGRVLECGVVGVDFDLGQERGEGHLEVQQVAQFLFDDVADHAFGFGAEHVQRIRRHRGVGRRLQRQQADLRTVAVGDHQFVAGMDLGDLFRGDPDVGALIVRVEAESIHIIREVAAEFDNPVMLYSVGKDSAVMLHLARKAFFPGKLPFPVMHVDTRWKFKEMYAFRDRMVEELGLDLIVHVNPDGVAQGINPLTHGSAKHTDIMKTEGLKQALDKHGFDAAFGGARRDEEKSRAKERVYSFRDTKHRWDPKNQRPELWNVYNGNVNKGESIRVFPLSNWTELDIWQYIYLEGIPIVPLYFAAERDVIELNGTWIMIDDERLLNHLSDEDKARIVKKKVRFRTLGDYPLTGAVESEATSLTDIIQEMLLTRTSERQGRVIDHDGAGSMEEKKRQGYF